MDRIELFNTINLRSHLGGICCVYTNILLPQQPRGFLPPFSRALLPASPRYYEARLSVRSFTLASRASRSLEEAAPWLQGGFFSWGRKVKIDGRLYYVYLYGCFLK